MSDVINGIAIGAGFSIPLLLIYTAFEREKAFWRGYHEHASAIETEGGDVKQAPSQEKRP